MYQAIAVQNGTFHTIEGDPGVAKVAERNFTKSEITCIVPHVGGFDERLPEVLDHIDRVDYGFVDGNHTYDATIRYFKYLCELAGPDTVLVFDDIRWSEEMLEAWTEIANDSRVTTSIDLFRKGIVSFGSEETKQYFCLRY